MVSPAEPTSRARAGLCSERVFLGMVYTASGCTLGSGRWLFGRWGGGVHVDKACGLECPLHKDEVPSAAGQSQGGKRRGLQLHPCPGALGIFKAFNSTYSFTSQPFNSLRLSASSFPCLLTALLLHGWCGESSQLCAL